MTRPAEWLLLDSVREGPDEKRRARVVLIASAITAALGATIAGLQWSAGNGPIAIAVALAAAVAAGNAGLLVASGMWRACGAVLCALVFAPAAYSLHATGGALPAGGYYLCLVPLLATLIGGGRSGALAATVCSLYLVGIEAMRRNGAEFPLSVGPEEVARSSFRGTLFFQGVLFVIALVYDHLRRASLADVAESAARYDVLVENAPDLVAELDADGIIRFASPVFQATLGWSNVETQDHPLTEWVHADDDHAFRAHLREALVRGSSSSEPVRLRDTSGGYRWFEPATTAYEAPDGERRLILVARDLTDRIRIEEGLRQSQKMDAIGQLAGGVAHDFNNLLTVIVGYAEELRDSESADLDAVDEILRAADQGEGLTRKLLAVSRPGDTERRPLDLNTCVLEMESLLGRMIGEPIALETDLTSDLPAVLADPGHIEQILVNLAVNGRDAMRTGGILQIRTSLERDHVVLSITDTGTGMTPGVRERMFEAFFTTKDDHEGTGLGLAVIYALVTDMRGEIAVESQPDAGTRISIHLPALSRDVVPQPSGAAPLASVPPRGTETVLLVEDRLDVRTVVQETLEASGYKVTPAPDGVRALQIIESGAPIDLVLSDVVMPRLTGAALQRSASELRPGLRFLLMSGHPSRNGDDPLPSGVPIIRKPFRSAELCRAVRAALDAPC